MPHPIDRYPWQHAAQRPLTVVDRMLKFVVVLGPTFRSGATAQSPIGIGLDIHLRYGITDRLEWGIPLFLTYRFGDLTAESGLEFAVSGGISGFGFSNLGFVIQPAAEFMARRKASDRVAFVASAMTVGTFGWEPPSALLLSGVGAVIDLSERWAVDVGLGPELNWAVDAFTGKRHLAVGLHIGGFRRPMFRFRYSRHLDLLGTMGVTVSPVTSPLFSSGIGVEVRL